MAYNVEEKAQYINKKHKNDLIIATDCCFSENEKLLKEDFSIRSGPIRPGAGIGRDLPSIGDMNILFCMSEEEVGGFSTLKNKTIKEVYNRTRKAAEFIFDLDEELSNINNNRQVVK
jgi:putative sporulation protein YyaC